MKNQLRSTLGRWKLRTTDGYQPFKYKQDISQRKNCLKIKLYQIVYNCVIPFISGATRK